MKNVFTLLAVFITLKSFACSCDDSGNFMIASKQADLIAIVKAVDYSDYFLLTGAAPEDINQPLSVTFEIIEVLRGQEEKKAIKVYGDNGYLCRPYVTKFKLGMYYVVAIFKRKEPYKHEDINITETQGDYVVSVCGEYWLGFNPERDTVLGRVFKKKKKNRELAMVKLRKELGV